jgi:hypothetical protein
MQAAIEAGIVTIPKEQSILNRFQCHQQVLYVSNILDAVERCIDKQNLAHQHPHKLVDASVPPGETTIATRITQAASAFLNCPSWMGATSDWPLPH